MEITFIRNATLLIKSGKHQILLDPMLGELGSLPSFSETRHKSIKNPIVSLPDNTKKKLEGVNAALITHCQLGHVDHLDQPGEEFLTSQKIPTYCRADDAEYLTNIGIATHPLIEGARQPFFEGYITLVPAVHGHGWIAEKMGPGVGFFIELPNEPSLYVAGDTVLTDDVRNALTSMKPDIAVVAAGNASLDVGDPILMSIEEVMEFASLAPGRVVANHLEALNHCPITRKEVASTASKMGLGQKVQIPADGETIYF